MKCFNWVVQRTFDKLVFGEVIAGRHFENIGGAFVRRDDGFPQFPLHGVSKVSDPVGATAGRGGNVPLHGGVAQATFALQPVEPAARAKW